MSLPGLGSSGPGLVMPVIKIGKIVGLPMLPPTSDQLIRAVIDTHLLLPDMFELTFLDQDGSLVDSAGLSIGTSIEIEGAGFGSSSTTSMIKGEITSIEAVCENMEIHTIVRGYEKAHRLQRARRSKTYLNMTESAIAEEIAGGAGLLIGDIDSSSITHEHIAQVAQTDWEFLTERAREIGYEVGVSGGKFFFRKASGLPAGGLGGAISSAVSTIASALGLGNGLTFRQNLYTFHPRVSAANITPQVEVRFWDGEGARVVSSNTALKTGTANLDNTSPGQLASSFTDGFLPSLPSLPSLPPIPGLPIPDFGSPPSDTAFVVVNHPLASGASANSAADQMAKGLADHLSSSFAEAEGSATGDPTIQAGSQVEIKGVPKIFCGKWTVTQARHVFDPSGQGYTTHFVVSGRSDRSLLALASGGATRERHSELGGLVCGVVTNVSDPDKKGKVKLALPWLSPAFETDWARVVSLGAGTRTGGMFLPEVGDEVLVGFEFGDVRRPYVLGGLVNKDSSFSTLTSAVTGGAVTGRGLATPAGNMLLFTDEMLPGPDTPPVKSTIVLGTGDSNMALSIDQVAGTVSLVCKPAPPASKSPAGTLTIDCSGLGAISIKGGQAGVKIESEGELELSGQMGVKITSNAIVQVTGQMIQLN